MRRRLWLISFFFNDTATTEIYTLSLHDALPICSQCGRNQPLPARRAAIEGMVELFAIVLPVFGLIGIGYVADRKSTRLNSSHANISYAVFCLKKKKTRHFLSVAQTT